MCVMCMFSFREPCMCFCLFSRLSVCRSGVSVGVKGAWHTVPRCPDDGFVICLLL